MLKGESTESAEDDPELLEMELPEWLQELPDDLEVGLYSLFPDVVKLHFFHRYSLNSRGSKVNSRFFSKLNKFSLNSSKFHI